MSRHEIEIAGPLHQQTQQETQQVRDAEGVSYLEGGQGTPILFLHGISGAALQFGPQLRHFGAARRAVAWDMPGYGASEPLPLVSIDALTTVLAGFIAAAGLDRPVLVGHSIGGMIAQRLLAEAPHSARALVLAQTSAAFGSKDPAWGERFVHDRLAPLDAGRTMASLADEMLAALLGDDPNPAGVVIARDCIARTPETTYRDTILALPGFNARAALPNIAVPTLLIAGTKDTNAPLDGMRRMAERIPGARLEIIEGAGHLAHLEQPTRFNAILDAFLDTLP